MASTQPQNQNPAAAFKARSNSIIVPKMAAAKVEHAAPAPAPAESTDANVWTTERQLVSSLAKLQKLESMIHDLRTLLPERLLEPLVPIVNPQVPASGSKALPKSPQMLYEQLSSTARAGVAEVQSFQDLWRSPELKEIWDHVDAKIQEGNGVLLQPSGMWERDYGALLEGIEKEEDARGEEARRAQEDSERAQVDGDWRRVVEEFVGRGVPGVRVVGAKERDAVLVVLVKAGMAFEVQSLDGEEGLKWVVSSKVAPGKPVSKLEAAVVDCLNSRPRQWDLAFVLDMIISYTTIKQTPCAKCTKMTDSTAQLPTIRRQSPPPQSTWEAFHPTCL
ncbi:hypothetical protein SI65_02393 [Aspergillus cristatus]|uniref:Uncharacterized protein n=1 Tax=Aspergillus cristatus TaxID=573508 RepID=A0A1E3BKS6_ASPCR|nr:hypothetical protein SI65_02393 [Aspergillus cristatus]